MGTSWHHGVLGTLPAWLWAFLKTPALVFFLGDPFPEATPWLWRAPCPSLPTVKFQCLARDPVHFVSILGVFLDLLGKKHLELPRPRGTEANVAMN